MINGIRKESYTGSSKDNSFILKGGIIGSAVVVGCLKRNPLLFCKVVSVYPTFPKTIHYQYSKHNYKDLLSKEIEKIFDDVKNQYKQPIFLPAPDKDIISESSRITSINPDVVSFLDRVFTSQYVLRSDKSASYALTLTKGEAKQKPMTLEVVDFLLSLRGMDIYRGLVSEVSISYPKTIIFEPIFEDKNMIVQFKDPTQPISCEITVGNGIFSVKKKFIAKAFCLTESGVFSVKIDSSNSQQLGGFSEVKTIKIGHVDAIKPALLEVFDKFN
jgi:hypothetical protein